MSNRTPSLNMRKPPVNLYSLDGMAAVNFSHPLMEVALDLGQLNLDVLDFFLDPVQDENHQEAYD